MIFVHSYMLPNELNETISMMPAYKNRLLVKKATILTENMQESRFLVYSYGYVLPYWQEHGTGTY